jgi:hypothetical protein
LFDADVFEDDVTGGLQILQGSNPIDNASDIDSFSETLFTILQLAK